MPQLVRFTVKLPYTTNLPRDVSENVFYAYVDDPANMTSENLAFWNSTLVTLYNDTTPSGPAVCNWLGELIDRPHCSITTTLVDIATGHDISPLVQSTSEFVLGASSGASTLPLEVALCGSYKTTSAAVHIATGHAQDASVGGKPVHATARRRGRAYFGPLTVLAVEGLTADRPYPNPNAAVRNAIGEALGRLFSTRRSDIGIPAVEMFGIYSRANRAFYKVDSVWTDNEWDTQRRRGTDPTSRFVFSALPE